MEAIRVERRAGLVTITLDRPAKKNAIDSQTWIELDRALADVAADPDDRALILAAGPTLALGLSKRLLDASSSVTLEQALEDEARCQHITHTSEDVREGIAAYLERREPRFQGC